MKEVSLIGYLAFGFPSIDDSLERAKHFRAAGIDTVEVVIPSADPYLDNEYIQMTMREALRCEDDYQRYFDAIEKLKEIYDPGSIIILAYSETIEQIGRKRFVEWLKASGFSQMILVGSTAAEMTEYVMGFGIEVSSWVPFELPDEAVEAASAGNGFVYLQSKSSGKIREGYPDLADCVKFLREHGIERPIYCGVGVSSKEDIRRIAEAGGEAAFIGSALLKQNTPEEIKKFIEELKNN